MIPDPQMLISEFCSDISPELEISPNEISHQLLRAPHSPPNLPAGKSAVYVFSLPTSTRTRANSNRVLKVGLVGHNSGPRFKYQHYNKGSAQSTLAGALENNPFLWNYLGIDKGIVDFGAWIMEQTDRDHFFIDGSALHITRMLEVYVKALFGPVFEGSLRKHS